MKRTEINNEFKYKTLLIIASVVCYPLAFVLILKDTFNEYNIFICMFAVPFYILMQGISSLEIRKIFSHNNNVDRARSKTVILGLDYKKELLSIKSIIAIALLITGVYLFLQHNYLGAFCCVWAIAFFVYNKESSCDYIDNQLAQDREYIEKLGSVQFTNKSLERTIFNIFSIIYISSLFLSQILLYILHNDVWGNFFLHLWIVLGTVYIRLIIILHYRTLKIFNSNFFNKITSFIFKRLRSQIDEKREVEKLIFSLILLMIFFGGIFYFDKGSYIYNFCYIATLILFSITLRYKKILDYLKNKNVDYSLAK